MLVPDRQTGTEAPPAAIAEADRPYIHLQRSVKRLLDVAFASIVLVAALPLLLGALLAILVFDRQFPLFRDVRVGAGGREFACWKLRSMRSSPAILERYFETHPHERADYLATRKLDNDPRRTAVGRFLRKTSIDELPQLVNVLRGEMSLVGPRPLSPSEFAARGVHAGLLATVAPGMTGLWQVSGRSNLDLGDRIQLDDYYARHWGILMDLAILARTPIVVLTARGAR